MIHTGGEQIQGNETRNFRDPGPRIGEKKGGGGEGKLDSTSSLRLDKDPRWAREVRDVRLYSHWSSALRRDIWAPRACAVLACSRQGIAWQWPPAWCLLPCIRALREKDNFQLFHFVQPLENGSFSIQIHWEVMSNLGFLVSLRNSKLLITHQWIWIEKNSTVHLHYFINRVRQNCQTNHFPILRERFLVSFFKILNLKNRWFDDVTLLLSMNFMKDRQGECLGKISHPYRVSKVYKHRFSQNTELAIGRTLNEAKKRMTMVDQTAKSKPDCLCFFYV